MLFLVLLHVFSEVFDDLWILSDEHFQYSLTLFLNFVCLPVSFYFRKQLLIHLIQSCHLSLHRCNLTLVLSCSLLLLYLPIISHLLYFCLHAGQLASEPVNFVVFKLCHVVCNVQLLFGYC